MQTKLNPEEIVKIRITFGNTIQVILKMEKASPFIKIILCGK